LKGKILIADDEEACRELIRLALEPRGYEVIEAGDGEEALRRIAEEKPALVLLDIQLPKLDGHSVIEALRKDPALASVRVLAFSAHLTNDEAETAREAGFNGLVSKPVNIAELRDTVDRMF
jgi:CheY-like chemotaxis protein